MGSENDRKDRDERMYDALLERAAREYPGFSVKFKIDSIFMKVLSWILFFNKRFMTGYVTTIGRTIYLPKRDWIHETGYRTVWKIIAHELVHIDDADKSPQPGWFGFWYLFPLPLAMLAFGAFWSPWWLLALVFAAPLPAPARMGYEMRGYAMSMAVNYWRYGSVPMEQKEHIADKFLGWDYYKMWPFENAVGEGIAEWEMVLARRDTWHAGRSFQLVWNTMRDQGVLLTKE